MSQETIYRSLFIQARRALKKELAQYLRSRRTIYRSRHASRKGHGKGQIADIVSIRKRPASVEDRAVPGHWEGDLIAGSPDSEDRSASHGARGEGVQERGGRSRNSRSRSRSKNSSRPFLRRAMETGSF